MAEALNMLRDAKSIFLGVTKPALSLRILFNIETPPLERTVGRVIRGRLVATTALRNVQLLVRKLRKLPVKLRSMGNPPADLGEVRNLRDIVPEVGLENLDVGSKKVDLLYSSASTRDKVEFYISIVRHLIKVGELGPQLDGLDAESQSDDEDSDREESGAAEAPLLDDSFVSPGSPIALASSAAPTPSDPLRTRAYAKVILNMERIRLKTTKIPQLMDNDAAERSKTTFSSRQIQEMKSLDTEFYNAMKNFITPFFQAYTMEEFRVALKVGFRKKDVDLFKVIVFSHFYPNFLYSPVTRRMIAHDYTFCVSWLGMWRRMKDETIEKNEAEQDELRRQAIAELKPTEDIDRELPADLRVLRAESMQSLTHSLEESLDADCMICLHTLAPKDQIVTDACQHLFCKDCIKGYMQYRKFIEFANCPCCRKQITCWMFRKDYKYAKQKLASSGALKKKIPAQYYASIDNPKLFADSLFVQHLIETYGDITVEENVIDDDGDDDDDDDDEEQD